MPSNVRADFTATEPGGGRLASKWYGIDAKEHADLLNDLNTYAVRKDVNTTAGFGWVIDEDSFASNLDTKVPTQQSVKAYIATAIAGGGGGGGEPVINPASPNPTLKYWRGDKTWQTLNQDVVPDGATNKAYTATEQSKLANIQANADVTGTTNVDAAGAVMNSDTSTAAMNFVINEGTLATNSATKVPTQQSVKTYVDANSGGAAASKTKLWQNWRDNSNGAPTTFDSGQAVTSSYIGNSAAALTVSSGKLTNTYATGTSAVAGYLGTTVDGTNPIKYMSGTFKFDNAGSNANGVSIVALLAQTAFPSGALSGTLKSPAHVLFTPTYFAFQTYDSTAGNAQTVGQIVAFNFVSGTEYSFEIAIDKDNNRAVMVCSADGIVREFKDTARNLIATIDAVYAVEEVLYTTPNADKRGSWLEFRATTLLGNTESDQFYLSRWRDLMAQGSARRKVVGTTAVKQQSIMVLGDSLAAFCAAYENTTGLNNGQYTSVDWLMLGNSLAGSPFNIMGAAATAGYTIASILSVHLPTVLAAKPRYCILTSFGGNDILASGELAESTLLGAEWIIDELIGAGITPILTTMLPLFHASNTGVTQLEIMRYNAWVTRQCQVKGLPLLPFHAALVDPATGSYKSGLTGDNIHPDSDGVAIMGPLVRDLLKKLSNSDAGRYHLASTNTTLANQAANPLLAGTLGASQTPTSWINGGAAASLSLAAAPGGAPGNELTQTCDSTGQVTAFGPTITAAPGDEIDFACIVEAIPVAGGTCSINVMDNLGGSQIVWGYSGQASPAIPAGTIMHARRIMPAGVTTVQVLLYSQVNGTVTKIRQPTLRNLTAMDIGF